MTPDTPHPTHPPNASGPEPRCGTCRHHLVGAPHAMAALGFHPCLHLPVHTTLPARAWCHFSPPLWAAKVAPHDNPTPTQPNPNPEAEHHAPHP